MLVTMPSIPKGPTGKPARINLAKKLELEPLEGVPKDLKAAFSPPFRASGP